MYTLQIPRNDVDFWTLHEEGILDMMTKRKMYPPKITVTFGALLSAEECVANIHFKGCSSDLDKEIILPWPARSGRLF